MRLGPDLLVGEGEPCGWAQRHQQRGQIKGLGLAPSLDALLSSDWPATCA